MIEEISISNFKSITSETINLSKVNVFIGENGCGKTNVLEAIATLGAAKDNALNINGLSVRGIRVTKPQLTVSSFLGKKQKTDIEISAKFSQEEGYVRCVIYPIDESDIFSEWKDKVETLKVDDAQLNSRISKILDNPENLDLFDKIFEKNFQDSKVKLSPSLTLEKLKRVLINDIKNDITLKVRNQIKGHIDCLSKYLIYNINTQSLRGIINISKEVPLGINGEGLDVLLHDFSKEEWKKLKDYSYLISWLDDIVIDESDSFKYQGHKIGRSSSFLYFKDKFMRKNNNMFAAENSNEGVLNILFYLALMISRRTPKFFAIDNIESSLNPRLCRTLMKIITELAKEQEKQLLITTHNPAVLDGLNLFDESQRLFVVKRTDEGHTKVDRIKLKPEIQGKDMKLSEMWMRGYLGGIPNNF